MSKIEASDVKIGTILNNEGQLVRVVDKHFMQMQQRAATYTFKVKNIVTGSVNQLQIRSGTVLDLADVTNKSAVYLYNSGDQYSFMEHDTSDMHEIHSSEIEEIIPYLKENLEVYLMMFEGKVLWVLLPKTIQYTIKETVPGVKGDRAQAGKKPATLETGIEVMVPLHKNAGDVVTLNTETREVS